MPGFDADDEGVRPPPHPLDRPWIHPSELRGVRSAPVAPTRPRRNWRRDTLLTIAAGTAGAVATVAVLGVLGAFERDRSRPIAVPPPSGTADAAEVARKVVPGIASVISTVDGGERRGSGIAVGPHEILTTAEVVDGSTGTSPHVEICLASGHRHAATEIGRDSVTGLVLLRVPTLQIDAARLVTTATLRAGDWVAAVGRSATSGPWVTSGVVTAIGGWSSDSRGTTRAGMITTSTELDAPARGGALVDRTGRVVGILAGATTGSASTRGDAMPSDVVTSVATQLASKGWVSHGTLGLRAVDTNGGATVTDIAAGSSAAVAGVRMGDRVVAISAVRTPDTAALVYELRRRSAGQRVQITVRRGGRTIQLTAVLGDAAATADPPVTVPATAVAQPLVTTGSGR